jgi:hypothetical protein
MKVPLWLVFGAAFMFFACLMTWGLADHHAVLSDTSRGLSATLRYPWGLVLGVGGGAACVVVVLGWLIKATE